MAEAATFLQELKRFGPETDHTSSISLEEAQAYCARLTSSHYENFSVVTWLTPKPLRPAFASVYAFCRWSDDLGDEVGDPERSKQLLHWWRSQLEDVYESRTSTHPVMVALAETIHEFAIPIDPFLALISAFQQDQVVIDYDDREQLLDYCKRSADPVGRLVLYLGRAFNEENAFLSDRTCTGLQLANFWQDVARDLDIGRIYLPKADRTRFRCSEPDLRARRSTSEFRSLMAYEVEEARRFLMEGRALIPRLPATLKRSVDLFNRGGLAILNKIESNGYDVLSSRPRLTKFDKLKLIGRAFLSRSSLRAD